MSCLLDNLHAFGRSSLGVKFAQAFCHRADLAIADLAIVELRNGRPARPLFPCKTFHWRRKRRPTDRSVSTQRIFSAAQISITVARVIPSGQASTRLVARSPLARIDRSCAR